MTTIDAIVRGILDCACSATQAKSAELIAALEKRERDDRADFVALLRAVAALHKEHVGDFTYTIRDRELEGWDGPRVKAWSDACATIDRMVKKHAKDLP